MHEAIKPDVRAAQRRAAYDFNVAQAALSRRAQADCGRWCLSALVLVHGAALALAGAASGPAGWLAVLGLTLALASGLAAWANWTFLAIVHTHWADDRLLDPDDADPVEPPRATKRIADLAFLVAMMCAAGSVAAAPAALLALGG